MAAGGNTLNIFSQHFRSHDYAQARQPPERGEHLLKFPW